MLTIILNHIELKSAKNKYPKNVAHEHSMTFSWSIENVAFEKICSMFIHFKAYSKSGKS